jgi:hypothetical protein
MGEAVGIEEVLRVVRTAGVAYPKLEAAAGANP